MSTTIDAEGDTMGDFQHNSSIGRTITIIIVAYSLVHFVWLRLAWLWYAVKPPAPKRTKPCSVLVVLGSGGHTAEMMRQLETLNLKNYSPRTYVLAETDKMSETKVRELEDMSGSSADEFCFRRIPRSREVGQSYVSSVVTTLRSQLSCLPLVLDIEPGLVLGNGPGTCVPIFFVCFALRFLGLRNNTKLMYVESVARVKNLSLTGKIIYKLGLCDNFLVQWPTLAMKYPRATYIGRLI